jgi:hypothetical protein
MSVGLPRRLGPLNVRLVVKRSSRSIKVNELSIHFDFHVGSYLQGQSDVLKGPTTPQRSWIIVMNVEWQTNYSFSRATKI